MGAIRGHYLIAQFSGLRFLCYLLFKSLLDESPGYRASFHCTAERGLAVLDCCEFAGRGGSTFAKPPQIRLKTTKRRSRSKDFPHFSKIFARLALTLRPEVVQGVTRGVARPTSSARNLELGIRQRGRSRFGAAKARNAKRLDLSRYFPSNSAEGKFPLHSLRRQQTASVESRVVHQPATRTQRAALAKHSASANSRKP